VVGSTVSDAGGGYRLSLAPGSDTVTASTPSAFPRCEPVHVDVTAGISRRLDISCDTSIR
jgi:hypothetical protein